MTVRHKRPDHRKAVSLMNAAERDITFTLTLPVNSHSASTIIRNSYESFRMLGEALLVFKGIESDNHIATIEELNSIHVQTARSVRLIDGLRKLRHSINYHGYSPSVDEAGNALSLVQSCFFALLSAMKEYRNGDKK